jgi:quercetin dioxygenase-like cupin family protein
MYPLPDLSNQIELPAEYIEPDVAGLYFRSVVIDKAGTSIVQHVHDHDHATFIGWGRARGWADGLWIGDKGRGEAFEIKAGQEHLFQALEDNTLLACTHDHASAESVKGKGI